MDQLYVTWGIVGIVTILWCIRCSFITFSNDEKAAALQMRVERLRFQAIFGIRDPAKVEPEIKKIAKEMARIGHPLDSIRFFDPDRNEYKDVICDDHDCKFNRAGRCESNGVFLAVDRSRNSKDEILRGSTYCRYQEDREI